MRVLTGSLIQESNSFSPVSSDLALFRAGCLLYDEDSLRGMAGTRTELGGCIAAASRHGVELVPTLAAWAASGGPMRQPDFEQLAEAFLARVRVAGHVDGVLLALHGAWVSEEQEDADGWLLAEVRRLVGADVPVVATLDFHANITRRMVANADALVGFRTYPHVDMYETGERAMVLLLELIRTGCRPRTVCRKAPLIVPPENMQTTDGPVAAVMREIVAAEADAGVLSASLFVVQPWLDVAELGATVVVVTRGDAEPAERRVDAMSQALWERRHALHVPLSTPADAVACALRAPERPVLLIDSADSVSAGAPGDSTALLRLLKDAPLPGPTLLTIVDPEAARHAAAADDRVVTLSVGGRLDPNRHQPVTVTGRARRVKHDRVTYTAGIGDGLTSSLGVAAVVEIGALRLLITECPVPCYDPALYRAADLEPAEAAIVVVKSANNFRWTYRDIAKDWVYVDAPGASTPRLDSLPFVRAPRPLFPFDDWDWRAGA